VPAPKTSRPRVLGEGPLSGPAEATFHIEDGRFLLAQADNYRWLPDGSVDMVLTDPPFNIARDTNFHTYEKNTIHSYRFDKDKGWDTYSHEEFVVLLGQWATEMHRVLRKGGTFAIFCADAYTSHLMAALTNAGLSPKRVLTWRKPNAVPINRKSLMMSACEYVVVGVKGAKATFNADIPLDDLATISEVATVLMADKAATVVEQAVRNALSQLSAADLANPEAVGAAIKTATSAAGAEAAKRARAMYVPDESYFRACVPNYATYNSKAGNRLHPTEKPVALLRYLVSLLSKPGDVLLDPFSGSGSTGEAALLLRRQVVLVEREAEFYEKSRERLIALNGDGQSTGKDK